ncbi:hypothetical protein GIB67_004465 [Kingdonia uniflora]|uniref:Small ribosomal subunit protein mS38 n=1 Tax=Kingdonia uniflora TaxID=39325 RepID=A0A7J7LPM1_9MAGN|nr:hypothetical protein GIB67_012983 [Kingdonia uniflora]KAF6157527.1 hypothetical protein GIB67_004465 [Kingdonia uniflora]
MAVVLQKLLKKPPSLRFIANFNNNPQTLNPTSPSPFLHQPHLTDFKPSDSIPEPPISPFQDQIKSNQFLQIYPSFSLGYFLNPIPPNGFDQLEEVVVSNEANTIWADSVKKKRKKKMNKHKYKKLRKLLRRKT